jgi:hypothetical protein
MGKHMRLWGCENIAFPIDFIKCFRYNILKNQETKKQGIKGGVYYEYGV